MDAGERFSRQTVLPQIGPTGQRRLGEARVLVVGCGALGSHTAEALLRAGVGHLTLVDRDVVELSNLHRTGLFTMDDLGRPKSVACAERLSAVAPDAVTESVVRHFGPEEAEALVPEADLVVDGLDNLETRYLVNDACVKHGIPWVYTAVLATYGLLLPIYVGRSACLRCLFPDPPAPGALPTCASAGILGPVPMAMGALQAAVALRMLLTEEADDTTELMRVEFWPLAVDTIPVVRAGACRACREHRWAFLESRSEVSMLCDETVQIVPGRASSLDLGELAVRLSPLGKVRQAEGVLSVVLGSVGFIVFEDGRALVKGVSDPDRARALYDQYIAS